MTRTTSNIFNQNKKKDTQSSLRRRKTQTLLRSTYNDTNEYAAVNPGTRDDDNLATEICRCNHGSAVSTLFPGLPFVYLYLELLLRSLPVYSSSAAPSVLSHFFFPSAEILNCLWHFYNERVRGFWS